MDTHRHSHENASEVRLLTVNEACNRLGCSRSTFYETILGNGLIAVRKLGAATRIRSDELQAFIEGLPASSPSSMER